MTSPAPRRRPAVLALAATTATAVVAAGGFGIGLATAAPVTPTWSSSSAGASTSTTARGWDGAPTYGGWPSPDTSGQTPQQTSGDTTSQATDEQLTGLVRIEATDSWTGSEGVGTGMVLTADGEVVTNHHVVEGSTSLEVTVMSTGETYTARVVGADATDDVALLQLQDASGLDTVTPDTDGVTTGEAVTAVGDGNGAAYLSAATGTVAATGQQITTQSEGTAAGETLRDLIEISSDVVPGYSGGATVDADGEVVGMTTAASSATGGSTDTTGYAVPIATVLQVADDLGDGVQEADYTYGYPAFLGIALGATGLEVQGVYDGTPAAEAGLAQGDTVTSVGGTAVASSGALREAIAAHDPGDRVRVAWTSADGSTHAATVTLARGPVA